MAMTQYNSRDNKAYIKLYSCVITVYRINKHDIGHNIKSEEFKVSNGLLRELER